MEAPTDSITTPSAAVHLNDLQSYLNTFNKEIESTGEPVFSVESHSNSDDGGDNIRVSPTEEEKQNIFLLDDGNVEASVLKTTKDYVVGAVITDDDSVDPVDGSGKEVVHTGIDMDTATMQDLTQVTVPVGGLSNINEGQLIRVQVPTSAMSEQLGGERMVYLDGKTPIQLIEKDGQLRIGDDANMVDPGGQRILQAAQTVENDEQDATANKIVLNTGGNNYQTVAIVPSDAANSGGEMNYVLIVSNPDHEKDDPNLLMPSGLEAMDIKGEQPWEVDFVEEDGTVKKLIRLISPDADGQLLACRFCSYTTTKKALLMRHMKTHSNEKPHKCTMCDRAFKTLASLQNHHNTHTGVRPHKCKQCEAAFTTSGELVRHIRYKHTFEKPHKCTECDYASVELSKLKRHMRSHTGERPYHCPHCNYASPDTYKLKRHLRIHTGEKPYQCEICGAKFTQSNSLKAHRLIHSGNKPVYQCELCPTTCGRRTDLKIHMQKLHSSEKPLQCKKCLQEFPDRYSYKMHIKTHEGEKCFRCDQCDYAAYSMRLLESHVLTHTGEKPFICEICGATFRQKQLLRRHKSLYHTPEDDLILVEQAKPKRARITTEHISTPLTAEQVLQGSLLNDMKEGKLGEAPKVVIVHPDGRVEEVTRQLQSLAQQHGLEEVMMKMATVNEQSEELNPGECVTTVINNVSGERLNVGSLGLIAQAQLEEDMSKTEGTQVSMETDSEQSNGEVKTNVEYPGTSEQDSSLHVTTMENGKVVPVSFQLVPDTDDDVQINEENVDQVTIRENVDQQTE